MLEVLLVMCYSKSRHGSWACNSSQGSQVCCAGKSLNVFSQLWWNHSAQLTVQEFSFSVVLIDTLPKFHVKLERATVIFSSWACWFNASLQFCFMTALLMRLQVIPANFIVFCNQSNFCHPSGSYAAEGKKLSPLFYNLHLLFILS